MKLSTKLVGIFSSLTILIAGIAVPQMLSAVAATQTNDRFYDSGEDLNAAYELDLAAQKNFYLTFKLKYTFPGGDIQGWQGPYVTVREGIKANLAYGFIGNEATGWNGAWTNEASSWTDEWLDVGIIVHENDLTITVAGKPVAGGIQVYHSTLENNVKPSKITIGGATCQFQLDDIRVRDILSTGINGGDDAHNWRPWLETDTLPDNYSLEFITALDTTAEGGVFFIEAAKNSSNHYLTVEFNSSKAGVYVKDYSTNGQILCSEEKDITAPATGKLERYCLTLDDKTATFTLGGTAIVLTNDSLAPDVMKRQFSGDVQISPNVGWDWGEKNEWNSPIFQTVVLTPVTNKYFNNFEVPIYSVTASSDNETMGTVTGGGDILSEKTVTVKATAKDGYRFVKWVDADGADVSTEAEYTFTPTADIALKAIFTAEATYAVTAVADPLSAGIVTGSGNVIQGQTVTVKATPNNGYAFVNWVDVTGAEVSKETEYTFTPTGDVTLTAKFEKILFTEVDADFEDAADLELFSNDKGLLSIVADPQQASNKVLKFHASGDNWGEAVTKADNYDNFELTAKILWSAAEINGSGNFGIKGRLLSTVSDGSLSCELSNWKCQFGVIKDNANSSGYLDYALTPDKWTQLKLVINGSKAAVYLDGVLKATYEGDIPLNETGSISLGSWTDGNIVVYLDDLKIVNIKEEEEKPEDKTFEDVDADFEDAADLDIFDDEKGLISVVADPQNTSNKVLKFHASASNWGEVRTKADNYDDFVLTAKIMWGSSSGGSGNFGLTARKTLATNDGALSCELSSWKSKFGVLKDNANSSDYQDYALEADKWIQLKLVVKGNKAELYLDGVLKASYAGELLMNKAGYITLGSWTDGDVVVYLDDLRIAHNDSQSPTTGSSSVLPCAAAALALSGATLIFYRRKKSARG